MRRKIGSGDFDMNQEAEQGIYLKMYTLCSACLGKGSFVAFSRTRTCLVCKGRGDHEKLITLEELKKLLEIVKL